MKSHAYQLFMQTLETKAPNRRVLVKQLMDLLCLEKEAVYRRLRQNVAFSFSEIELIAKKYQISLDYISSNQTLNDILFYLADYDFLDTPKDRLKATEQYLKQVEDLKEDPNSEIGAAVNAIPTSLLRTNRYKTIYYFIVYKWMYQYGSYHQFPQFDQFELPDHLLIFNDLYHDNLMHTNYSAYVFDEDMFASIVKDILYFKNIGFLDEVTVRKLKGELMDFLYYIERIAASGKFDTGKRVDIFISQMTIESGYSYIESEKCNYAFLKHFTLNYVTSANAKSIPRIKNWIKALKRSSYQISVSGELQRMYYLNQQREVINQLGSD